MEYLSNCSMKKIKERVLYKACFCREFELSVQRSIIEGVITCPVYLSIGQELLPAVLSEFFPDSYIFAQHRAHSTYLCFGGDPKELITMLKGSKQGSASINIPNKMLGHSGFMGDQVPLSVGFTLSNTIKGKNSHTLSIMGDASAEEDYVLASLGFASSKKLPMLFVVEDNNLSILTEKKVRRSWEMSEVAKSFGIKASFDVCDSLDSLLSVVSEINPKETSFLNIRSERICWHAGSGTNEGVYDRLKDESKEFPGIIERAKLDNKKIWDTV